MSTNNLQYHNRIDILINLKQIDTYNIGKLLSVSELLSGGLQYDK